MTICILKGIEHESIDAELYPIIKKAYQTVIDRLLEKGFKPSDIHITFNDETRQINFDYYPDEIEALACYAEVSDEDLQFQNTLWPFEDKKNPHKKHLKLCHFRTQESYIDEIQLLCKEHDDLAKQNQPLAIWRFPEAIHTPFKKAIEYIHTLSAGNEYGLFINEIHSQDYPKKFLEVNLDYFAKLGFKTLFFEFLFYDRHQQQLDDYLTSDSETLPSELEAFLYAKTRWSGCKYSSSSYANIVRAAKKAGIRIVGLDSWPSVNSPRGEIRLKSFNGRAANIIKKESRGQPYLVFLGLDHGYKNGHDLHPGIKSVAELLPKTCSIFLTERYNPLLNSQNGPLPCFNRAGKLRFFSRLDRKEFSLGLDIIDEANENKRLKLI